jgi:hypothetical protein
MLCGKAAFAVDAGFPDAEAGREFEFHLGANPKIQSLRFCAIFQVHIGY